MGLLHASILNFLPDIELAALCEKSGVIRRFLKKCLKTLRFEEMGVWKGETWNVGVSDWVRWVYCMLVS